MNPPDHSSKLPIGNGLCECLYQAARDESRNGAFGRSVQHLMRSLDIASVLMNSGLFDIAIYKCIGDSCLALLPFVSSCSDKLNGILFCFDV